MLLTDRARQLEEELVPAARAVSAAATRGLDDTQVAAFMGALAALTDNLAATLHRPHMEGR